MNRILRSYFVPVFLTLWLSAPASTSTLASRPAPAREILTGPAVQIAATAWVIRETDVPIQRLAPDGDSLWAGAYKGGLFRWDLERGPLAHFTTGDGLPGMDVVSLAVDDAGGLASLSSSTRGFHLASPVPAEQGCSQETVDIAARLGIEAVEKWTRESAEGLGRVVRLAGEDGATRLVGLTREGEAFRVILLTAESIWNEDTVEGLARIAEFMPERSIGGLEDIARYPDSAAEDSLAFVRDADLSDPDNVLVRVEDSLDIVQWRGPAMPYPQSTIQPLGCFAKK